MIEIFADGACTGNPGPGGWGVLIRTNGQEETFCGGEAQTTNNRMELMAVIQGLLRLKKEQSSAIHITTDSQYVCKGATEWLSGWKKNGWKTSQNTPVKNIDLWQALDAAMQPYQISWFWVRGHQGHRENEMVDALARSAISKGR